MMSGTDPSWEGRSDSWAAVKYEGEDNTRLWLKYEPVGFTVSVILLCVEIVNTDENLLQPQSFSYVFESKNIQQTCILRNYVPGHTHCKCRK